MPEILLATYNTGKLRELRQMTADSPWTWRNLQDFPGIPPAIEDGATFAENACRKALHYWRHTRRPTLAEDSGLEVDALGGEPGVRSARFAGEPCDDSANNRRLVALLREVPPERRTARYRCAMALAVDDRIVIQTSGTLEGRIIDDPRGGGGFGYDPHFLIPALGRTAAELDPQAKNQISHRGQALRALLAQLATILPP